MTPPARCEACGVRPPARYRILYPEPATLERLAALSRRHGGIPGATWPAAWLCERCLADLEPVMIALARLPIDELLLVDVGLFTAALQMAALGLEPGPRLAHGGNGGAP